jgi:C4-dicarboxylate-specific signal transduction histidine kinase
MPLPATSPVARLQAALRQRARVALPVAVVVALLHGAWTWRSEHLAAQETFDVEARITHRLVSERLAALDTLLKAFVEAGRTQEVAQRLLALDPLARSLGVREGASDAHAGEPLAGSVPMRTGLQGQRLLLVRPFNAAAGTGAQAYLSIAVPELLRVNENLQALNAASITDTHGESSEVRLAGEPTAGRWQADFSAVKPLQAGTGALQFKVHGAVPLSLAGWLVSGLLGLAAVAMVLAWGVLRQSRLDRQRAERAATLSQAGRLQAMGELAAQVAHELNQPLAALLSQSQGARRLLDDEPPDAALLRRALDNNIAQAQRAAAIVQRLRASVAGAAPVRVPVALGERLREMLFVLEPRLRALGAEVVQHGCAGVSVLGDPVQVDQILHNLLCNALDAMEQAGTSRPVLRIEAVRTPPWVVLSVHDSGPGVPVELRAHLFEPFVSAKPGGTGLGLAIARTLAEHQGGELQLDLTHTEPGARFVLRLPAQPA